ncbi:MAG: GTPase ObgE [Candidatus Peribacteraceae bacterium]|nr:GTPase ObgE [Candidatus Peribacteraceae bacterium]MBP9850204.1 GTPase ObgE [Candidatus Peribacteraceae bacterium]
MFLDHATIEVAGGNGGNGAVAWRREKYVPEGGPAGGDGGRGGNIIIQADPNTDTLSDFASRKKFKAKDGEKGGGANCAGHEGLDVILMVPPGTMVYDVTDEKNPKLIADLQTNGDQLVAGRGGKGGFGNAHFKTSVRQAPDFSELGEPGERRKVRLELKLVADIGIIGYPSVGKSSLIAAVSKARPKIADYPFTTLVPNLGVVKVFDREFILCDVPGLIEGASEGKGLGYQFLRHIERCGVLLHVLDVERDDIVADYKSIRKELQSFSPELAKKPEFVVLNKIDIVQGDAKPWTDALKKAKIKVFATISAVTRDGTDDLMKKLLPIVLEEKQKRTEESEKPVDEKNLPVIQPHLLSDKMGAFRIEHVPQGLLVRGKRLEQFTAMTDFKNPSGRSRFRDVAQRIGLIRALEKEMKVGEDIFIGNRSVKEYLL